MNYLKNRNCERCTTTLEEELQNIFYISHPSFSTRLKAYIYARFRTILRKDFGPFWHTDHTTKKALKMASLICFKMHAWLLDGPDSQVDLGTEKLGYGFFKTDPE